MTEPNNNDELWRVQLSTGEIRMMTVDGLDEAFDRGVIDARVRVLAPGSSTWTTLGEAAGLDGAKVEQTPSLSPVAISSPEPSSSTSPVQISQPALEPSGGDDLFSDELLLSAGRRRRLILGGIAAAAAMATALAVVAARLADGSVAADVKAAATAVESPTPAVEAPRVAVPSTEAPPAAVTAVPSTATDPAPTRAAEPETEEPSAGPKKGKDGAPALSDWQKKLLVDADKAREEKARAKRQDAEKVAPKRKPQARRTNGLLNSGDRFDPLNGAL
jgi:hypothetical protein